MKKKILLIALAIVLLIALGLFIISTVKSHITNYRKVEGTWENHMLSKLVLELNKDKTFRHIEYSGIYSYKLYSGTYSVSGNKITMNADLYEYHSNYPSFYSDGEGVDSEASDEVFVATYNGYSGNAFITMDGYKYRRTE